MNRLKLSGEQFRYLAEDLVQITSDYLSSLGQRRVFPSTSGAETVRLFSEELPEHGLGERALSALADVIAHSRAQNGRFFGYVQGSAPASCRAWRLARFDPEPEHDRLALFPGRSHNRAHS